MVCAEVKGHPGRSKTGYPFDSTDDGSIPGFFRVIPPLSSASVPAACNPCNSARSPLLGTWQGMETTTNITFVKLKIGFFF